MGRNPRLDVNGEPIPSMTVQKFGLTYVRPMHREIARRLVLGQKVKDIAADLNITPTRISTLVNSPVFKKEIKRLEDQRDVGVSDVTRTLREVAPVCLEQVERLMYNAKSEKVRLSAAQDLLDRAGYGAVNKNLNVNANANVPHGTMTDDELKRLILARMQRAETAEEVAAKENATLAATRIEFDVEEAELVEPTNECSQHEQLERLAKEFFS